MYVCVCVLKKSIYLVASHLRLVLDVIELLVEAIPGGSHEGATLVLVLKVNIAPFLQPLMTLLDIVPASEVKPFF